MESWTRSPWKLPLLSGLAVGWSYFSFSFPLLNLVAFLPLLLWLDANPETGAAERMRAGVIFGLAVNLTNLHWMYAMLRFSWLAAVLYVSLASVFALRLGIAVTLAGWFRRRAGLSFAVVLPLSWLPLEWAETWGDLRMTADHTGQALAGNPFLVQFADLVGPYGVGAFGLAVNGLVYGMLAGRRRPSGRRHALALGLLLVAVLGYDGWAWTHPPAAGRTVRVGLVQPNIPLDVKHDETTVREQWETLRRMTRRAAEQGAEIVVWPETARPVPVYHRLGRPDTFAMPETQHLAASLGVSILAGVEYYRILGPENYDVYNAALVVRPDGSLSPEWTAKTYLVPFVEKVPFRSVLGPLFEGRSGELRWMAGGFKPPPRVGPLEIAGVRAGVLVCYEELYFDLARRLRNEGAEVEVVITNDAWFGRTLFQPYQANTVRLRAIESRMSLVRAANTGISGFVDPLGRYHRRTALDVPAVEVRDVSVAKRRTVYDRTGDVVAWLCILGLAAAVGWSAGTGPIPPYRPRQESQEGAPARGALPEGSTGPSVSGPSDAA